jgi:hypothetical protein
MRTEPHEWESFLCRRGLGELLCLFLHLGLYRRHWKGALPRYPINLCLDLGFPSLWNGGQEISFVDQLLSLRYFVIAVQMD